MELPVIPMSFEAYEVMERPFGWKVEYWDSHARLSPRAIGVTTKVNLSRRNLSHNYILVPVSSDDREAMIAGSAKGNYTGDFGESYYRSTFTRMASGIGYPAS
jgi:hypothetical protein